MGSGGRTSTKPPSQLGSKPPTGNPSGSRPPGQYGSGGQVMPGNSFGFAAQNLSAPVAAPSRSNALVFVLIAILVGAIGVLAYLVLTK